MQDEVTSVASLRRDRHPVGTTDRLRRNQHWSENISDDIVTSLKRYYANRLIEVLDGHGPIEVLSWKREAIAQCHFALTYFCNLKCKHCLISKTGLPELSTSEVLDVIDQLWELGCATISFSGGETTIRRDFPAIVAAAHSRGIEFGFNSNGTLLTPADVSLLRTYVPSHIGVSVYGDCPEVHDRVTRVEGSFQRTIDTIRLLVDSGLHVTIKCMVMRDNYAHVDGIRELASSLGCKIVFDAHILPKQDGSPEPLRYALDTTDLHCFQLLTGTSGLRRENNKWSVRDGFVCSAGFDRCAIDPYGYVYPCALLPVRLGSVREGSLRHLLAVWSGRANAYLPRASDLRECQACEYRDQCSPCPGVSLIEEGDAKRKSSWICSAATVRCRAAGATG